MKSKTLFTLFGTLCIILSLTLVLAASLTISNTNIPSSVDQDAGSFDITFDIENTGADTNVSFSSSVLTQGTGSISVPNTELLQNQTKPITATVNFNAGQTGNIEGTIIADPSGAGSSKNFTFSVPIISESFCTDGAINDSGLTLNVDISNKGDGTDSEDDAWFPLDEIAIEVELENDGGEDLDDVVLEIGLFEEGSSANMIDDMLWISEDDEEIKIGDVDEDEKESHIFVFKVDPEIEKGDYVLKIKAYPKGDEDVTCIDYSSDLDDFGTSEKYAEISIDREDASDERAVIVDIDKIQLPEIISCSDMVTLTAEIFNIGDEDQEQVKVTLKNSALGIDLEKEIRENLDQGDNQEIVFAFNIPENADEKEYTLEFRTFYDYDDNDDSYDEFSDIFTLPIRITSCGPVVSEEPTISATLASDAQVDEELIVQVAITNNMDSEGNFVISVEDYNAWAELVDVSPQILIISQGSTQQATVILKPTQSGTNTFSINTIYNSNEKTQTVQVTVAEKAGLFTGAFAGIGETGLYIISAIIIILIIIIIALIVRVSRAPRQPEF
jgi:hypothetical protein